MGGRVSDIGSGPTTAVALSRAEERRKLLWAGRTVFDVVLGGEETGGTFAVLDQWGRRGDCTPLHVHHTDAEVFYVLEGAITAWAGEDVTRLEAGGAVYLPAGLAHAFRVDSEEVRLITVSAPAGFAAFVREAGVPFDGSAPATWDFDIGRLMASAPRHDIEIVGPPPSDTA